MVVVVVVVEPVLSVPTVPGSMVVPTFSVCARLTLATAAKANTGNNLSNLLNVFMACTFNKIRGYKNKRAGKMCLRWPVEKPYCN